MKFIHTDHAPQAVGPYSQAVRSGDLLFCSGQIPLDPESMQLVSEHIAEQTRQVFDNIRAVLASEQLDLPNVIKATVFLTDLNDFNTVNTIYQDEMGDHKPARSTIQVAALPLGAKIEIEVVASYR